jgi:hypothetical protein
MTFATILLSADKRSWQQVGARLVAVDNLVHNFLHRSGLISLSGRRHAYGPGCYGPKGCAGALARLAGLMNAQEINPEYPPYFPRAIQHAIWRYAAQEHHNVCNGNRIDDRRGCKNKYCIIYRDCARRKPTS